MAMKDDCESKKKDGISIARTVAQLALPLPFRASYIFLIMLIQGDTGMGKGYVRTWENFSGAATGACFWYGRETLI